MKLAPVRVTPPAELPVSAEEAKRHLRVSHSDEDADITDKLKSAVNRLDGYDGLLRRCLITQTWRQDYTCWPRNSLVRLPLCDVQSIVSVKYSDAADAEQTVDPSLYQVHHDAGGSFVWFRAAFTYPSLYDDRLDPVRITFKVGYGDASGDVPEDLRSAVLLILGDLYENREGTVVGAGIDVRPLPLGVDALIALHRRVSL